MNGGLAGLGMLLGAGLFVSVFVALGFVVGYLLAIRQRARVAADAVADVLPTITQRMSTTLDLRAAPVNVPVTVALQAQVAKLEPLTVQVIPLPPPSNVELARRIVSAFGNEVGPRRLGRVLDIAPSSAYRLLAELRAEDSTPQEGEEPEDETLTDQPGATG